MDIIALRLDLPRHERLGWSHGHRCRRGQSTAYTAQLDLEADILRLCILILHHTLAHWPPQHMPSAAKWRGGSTVQQSTILTNKHERNRAHTRTAIATCRQARAHLQRLPDRFSLASSSAPLSVPRHEPPRHCAVVERLRYLCARPGLQLSSQAPCCDGALLALLLRRTARGSGSGQERRKRARAFARGKVARPCGLTGRSRSQPTCRCSRLGPLSRTQRRR